MSRGCPLYSYNNLNPNGKKSTGPVGHSSVWACPGPRARPPWPWSGPKSTGPVGHSRVLAQSQPALLGTQGSWPNWPKVNRPCWALKGRPKVNRPCWALKGLGPQLGTQGSWPKVNRPCWALKGRPKVNRPCWALKGLGPKSTGPVGHSRVLA